MDAAQTSETESTQSSIIEAALSDFRPILQDLKQSLETSFENSREFRNTLLCLQRAVQCKQHKPRSSEATLANIRQQMATAIAGENILSDLCILARKSLFQDMQQNSSRPEGELRLLELVLAICHSCTDASWEFSSHLVGTANAVRLIQDLLAVWTQKHIENKLDDDAGKCLERGLAIIYNVLWQDSVNLGNALFAMRQFGIAQLTSRLLQASPDRRCRLFAFLILVYLCSDEESAEMLYPGDSVRHQDQIRLQMSELLKAVAKADGSRNRRTDDGFHIVEVLQCILQFSKRDQHKPVLIGLDCLSVLKPLLQKRHAARDDEVRAFLEIALSLALYPTCSDEVKRALEADLAALSAYSEKWKNSCQMRSLILLIRGKFEPNSAPARSNEAVWTTDAFADDNEETLAPNTTIEVEDDGTADVNREFVAQVANTETDLRDANPKQQQKISASQLIVGYSRNAPADATFAKWLVDQLNKIGQASWTVDITPKLLEEPPQQPERLCTIDAINDCRALISCVSRAYEEDCVCRHEVQLASELRKPWIALRCNSAQDSYSPGGWLLACLGDRATWEALLDFSNRNLWADSLDKLSKLLKEPLEPFVVTQSSTIGQQRSRLDPVANFKNWTPSEVGEWLDKHELPKDRLNYLDGGHLQFLADLKKHAPEAFYRMLREDLGLSGFLLVYRFAMAVESLQIYGR